MKAKFILSVVFLAMTLLTFGQTSGLNQINSKGKKEGKWIVYLDKDWEKVDDSTKALYARYTYFDSGTNIYPMGSCGGKGYKLEPGLADNKKTTLLDGEYKWYDAKGKLSSVHVFKNGEYFSCLEYFPTGELSQHFDFTKKCAGQPHGWEVIVYDKKGNIKLASMTCKDKNGKWPPMRG